jgi:hypothetical protein
MLGTIMNNYLAPVVFSAVRAAPQLIPDVGTIAQLYARGYLSQGQANHYGSSLGYNAQWMAWLREGALTMPAQADVWDMQRRGLIGHSDAVSILTRAGMDSEWAQIVAGLLDAPLSPADAALGLLRGNISAGKAHEVAKRNGVSMEDLQILVDNTGEPPALEELLSLWRRGHIGTAELEKGIRQSRVRNEWIPAVKQMGIIPPSPADALDAYLKGQISEGESKRRFQEAGGDPTWFDDAYNAAGAAPTPDQLGVMANRGIIPWTGTGPHDVSFEQGFREGPWRNKWLPIFRKASVYLPPPRTVTALLNEGAITTTEAQNLLMDQGLPQNLAHAYTLQSSRTKTKKSRDLAVGQIEALYKDQAIDNTTAAGMLTSLGYDDTEAQFILTIQDLQRVTQATTQAIGRIHTQFTNHIIDRSTASALLDVLSVPAAQRDDLLGTWDIERLARVRTLTEAQVVRALKKGLTDEAGALERLVQLGYSPDDAAILIKL